MNPTSAPGPVSEVAHFLCWEERGQQQLWILEVLCQQHLSASPTTQGKKNGQLFGCGESILLIVERGRKVQPQCVTRPAIGAVA